ncbi:MAG TPA: T9SS type A sorting domain-containing protein, partial [Chitinophagaceae bacterium]
PNLIGSITATDNCVRTITQSPTASTALSSSHNQQHVVTFTATDAAGNTATCSATLTAKDVTAPVISVCASDQNVDLNGSCQLIVPNLIGSITATDNCVRTITQSPTASTALSSSHNQQHVVTFMATDAAGNTATCSATLTAKDVTVPVITSCPTDVTVAATDPGSCYATNVVLGSPSSSDNCSTNTSNNAPTQYPLGQTIVKWTVTDAAGNTATCNQTVTVQKIQTTTTVTVSPVSQQYSDKVVFTATITPASCDAGGSVGGSVTFKIGTMAICTAPVATDGTATCTASLLEDQVYDANLNDPLNATSGPLDPQNNPKTVSACFSEVNSNFSVATATTTLAVTCEDADITYNGGAYFGANPNTNSGTITVSAFVQDKDDDTGSPETTRGDIRNATITFREGSSAGSLIGSADIPVGLVNPNNFQDGIATSEKSYTLTNTDISCGGKIIDVWAGTGNYYCGSEIGEVVPVCLSLPGGDFVTGGGWIIMQNSEGSYAGTDNKRMHAALAFKWNKSNKNLQGNSTIIYKRVVDGVQKVYQIKSNSIQSMIVNTVNNDGVATNTSPTYRMATIVTKANLRDLTDPDFPVSVFGNLTLTITAWESINVTNGSEDRISVQLMGSGSQGLIFSSNWISGATKWQQLDGGKMQVRNPAATIPCPTCPTKIDNTITAKAGEMESVPEVLSFNVKAFPNPTQTEFNVYLEGATDESVSLIVYDALGRKIKQFEKQGGNIPIHFGRDLKGGIYILEVRQGKNSKTVRLIKQN